MRVDDDGGVAAMPSVGSFRLGAAVADLYTDLRVTLRRAAAPTPSPGPAAPPACPLTPRESQVLRLLADGLSDREVAARLVISPKTVEKHVGAVRRKTGTTSRTAAVVRALDRGWLAPDRGRDGGATGP